MALVPLPTMAGIGEVGREGRPCQGGVVVGLLVENKTLALGEGESLDWWPHEAGTEAEREGLLDQTQEEAQKRSSTVVDSRVEG